VRTPYEKRAVVALRLEWGSMVHKLMTRQSILDMYDHEPEKRLLHEAIMPNEPCVMYVDMDGEGISLEDGNRSLETVIRTIAERCQTRYGFVPPEPPMVYDACRDGKFSVHVIYSFWVATPMHAKEILSPAIFPDNPKLVDLTQYPQTSTPAFMRMPWSMQYKKPYDPMTAPYPRVGGIKARGYHQDLFLRGCISVGMRSPPSSGILTFPIVFAPKRYMEFKSGNITNLPPGVEASVREGIGQVLAYVKMFEGDFTIDHNVQIKDRFTWHCQVKGGLYCMKRAQRDGDGKHPTNWTFLGMTNGRWLYQSCPGEHCRGRVYWPEDLFHIYRPYRDLENVMHDMITKLRF
jgi:hypothetical protein